MLACLKGKAAFAKDLIERGANVNARDDDGLTALIAAVAHPEVVALLLDAGAHAHLRYSGAHATLVTGTALENAAAGGHAAAEALLKERGGGGGGSTPRDVHALEQATLMRVLAAMMLEHSAQLGDEHAAARAAWLQGLIEANFADAADQAALASSPRFAKYGDDRLKADAWYEVAQREGQYLSKHAKFEAVVEELAPALVGGHAAAFHVGNGRNVVVDVECKKRFSSDVVALSRSPNEFQWRLWRVRFLKGQINEGLVDIRQRERRPQGVLDGKVS